MAVASQTKERSSRGRQWMVGANVVLASVLVIAITGALQWGAYKLGGKADWTSSSINSLSEGTTNLLDGLEQKVTLTSTYFKADPEGENQPKFRRSVEDLLSLYQSENRSNIEVGWVNPLKDHAKYKELFVRLGDKEKFREQSAGHRELLGAFESDLLPQISELLTSELDAIAAQSESLAGRGAAVLGEIQLLLDRWQREAAAVQEEVQAAAEGDLPRYTAAVGIVRSLYTGVSKALKDIAAFGQKEVSREPNMVPAQHEFLAGAQARYQALIDELDRAVEASGDLPRLDLEDVARQLAADANAVIVETETDAKVLGFADVWPSMDPQGSVSMAFKDRAFEGEQKLSSAILQLTRQEKTAVIFVRHGGSPLLMGGFMPGQPQAPFAQVKMHLEDLNFVVQEWDLAAQAEPPEIDPAPVKTIYVVLKPTPEPPNAMRQPQQTPFGEAQKQAILDAIAAGGRALFLVGWFPGQFGAFPAPYEYAEYLKGIWGIQVDADVLLLQATPIGPGKYGFTRPPINMMDNRFGGHPIVEGLGMMRTALPLVAPLELAEPAPEGVTLDKLVWCDRREGLWGVKNIQAYQEQLRNESIVKMEEDLEGPFTVAAAGSKDDAKVVVISSRDFCVDGFAFAREIVQSAEGYRLRARNPGNMTLLVNSLHWLNDNTAIMNLGRPIDTGSLEIAEGGTLSFLRVLAWGIWPALAVICGGAVWLVRRR
ncbi:MAG TPA: Gldg family protein [Phycisphaerae bacterium]|nr:Gldg family protein [Phycisphaerae bacterium]